MSPADAPNIANALASLAASRARSLRRESARDIARGREPHPVQTVEAERAEYLCAQAMQLQRAFEDLIAERDAYLAELRCYGTAA